MVMKLEICGSFAGTTGATVVEVAGLVVGAVVVVELLVGGVVLSGVVVGGKVVSGADVVGGEVVSGTDVVGGEVVDGPRGVPEQNGVTGKFWLASTSGVKPQYSTDVS